MIFKDQLEAVYRLIERPENWTRGVSARDADGNKVYPKSVDASKWCLDGAFSKCGLDALMSEIALGIDYTPGFNDKHEHHEVLALLQSAIDRAPSRP